MTDSECKQALIIERLISVSWFLVKSAARNRPVKLNTLLLKRLLYCNYSIYLITISFIALCIP